MDRNTSGASSRSDRGSTVSRALAVLAVLSVVLLAALGVAGSSGPSTTPVPASSSVVVVSVPGLRWTDLDAVPAPALRALLGGDALLSIRAMGPRTGLQEAYLTLGAGNRIGTDVSPTVVDGCTSVVGEARDDADDELTGAEPGALGEALHDAGLTTSVFGPDEAVGALMDESGCVDAVAPADTLFDGGESIGSADVTLVELAGLAEGSEGADRAIVLADIDVRVAALTAEISPDALVLLVAPIAPTDRAEVTVLAMSGSRGAVPAATSLVSASTRRAGYVTLTDVAPTVLDSLGLEIPESMSGTAIVPTVGEHSSSIETYADLTDRISFRDRAVGPVSVVLVVFIALAAFAGAGRRTRMARPLATIVAAYIPITFLCGLVSLHRLPLDFVAVAIPFVAMMGGAFVVSLTSRLGRWGPVGCMLAALWLLLLVDIITGGRLQLNTVLGYTPTVAGRFQGFGNLAFGLFGAAALVVAMLPMLWRPTWVPIGSTVSIAWVAWVGAVTIIADAAPAFGSDVGGTIALIPAFAVLLLLVSGRRVSSRRLLLAGIGTAVVLVGLAAADLARSPGSRTHLGRFADSLLHGDGGLVLRRKLRSNLGVLTSSFWTIILFVLLVAIAVEAWRRREALLARLDGHPLVRWYLAGFGVLALLGFAFNDSGIAVPAIMMGVAVPWLVVQLMAPAVRAGRE